MIWGPSSDLIRVSLGLGLRGNAPLDSSLVEFLNPKP